MLRCGLTGTRVSWGRGATAQIQADSRIFDFFNSEMAMALNRNFAAGIISIAAVCIVWSGTAWADENERGEDLYRLCASCHAVDGSGNHEVGAPAIAGMAQWWLGRVV